MPPNAFQSELPARPWRHLLLVALLIGVYAAVSIANPAFATAQNLRDLLVQSAPTIIVGCGMTLVVLTGEIDISVGSLMGFLAAVMGVLASPQRIACPLWLVVGMTLAAGAGIGLLNGLLIAAGRVPSIIATLGTMTILRGATETVLNEAWITDLPPGLRAFGVGGWIWVPWSLWTAAAVAACSIWLTRRSRLGLHIRAVGGNPVAAAVARISADRVKLVTFAMTGTLTAVAALVTVPQQSTIEPGIGNGLELVVITAVVVGGTSIRGGSGGIAGTLLAAMLLGSIRTSLLFLNLGDRATYWERAIQGGFILAAVLADHVSHSRRRNTLGAAA